jgi:hypothetical protein
MLVTRLQMTAMRDKSPQNVSLLAGQLHELFAENRTLPAAKKDLAKLGL